jgi:hypothetical protein
MWALLRHACSDAACSRQRQAMWCECLSACVPACQPACQPASLPACQPASLPACQPASQPARPPASQPACLLAWLRACVLGGVLLFHQLCSWHQGMPGVSWNMYQQMHATLCTCHTHLSRQACCSAAPCHPCPQLPAGTLAKAPGR